MKRNTSLKHINITGSKFRLSGVLAIMLFVLSLVTACGGRPKDVVIVAGSTSVQPYAEILAELFAVHYPGSEIDIQGGGSSAGITAAQNGTADIGMSSRALKEEEQGLHYVEIAKDGLAIIINPGNPIQDVTLEQIRGIYSGKITNWSELGGKDAKIHMIAREDGSGTRSAFEDLVMGKDYEISPKSIVQNSNGAVRQLVSDDVNAIGFISLGLVNDNVKALKLDGIAPTRENVINDSYPLYRPFLYVFVGTPEGLAKEFIDFTLSHEGQQLLESEGLIPVIEGNS